VCISQVGIYFPPDFLKFKKMTHKTPLLLAGILLILGSASCDSPTTSTEENKEETIQIETKEYQRIVTLSGVVSEIVAELGLGDKIVGTDITSTYPEAIQGLPKLGHITSVQAEGIISLQPDLVIAKKEEIKAELAQQLEAAGVKTLLVEQEYSINGTKKLIETIAKELNQLETANQINATIDEDISKLEPLTSQPTAVFIYARGVGNMMVGGSNTSVAQLIQLAGGINGTNDFEEYKPLTAESMVAANPDLIILFESGMNSLQGADGIQQIPSIAVTTAAKKNQFFALEGQYLAGFGPRVGKAALELNQKFKSITVE
jgi:heme transport system substrate-binding protein